MSWKRRVETMLCKHDWLVQLVSPTSLQCKCKKCSIIKKSKYIEWDKPFDPYKKIKW